MKVAIALDKLAKLQKLVDEQAEDWDLWFDRDDNLMNAKSRSAKLRIALRAIHALIEE